ncbi:MAG: hypothetical protein WD826_11835 [Actinomycetota bacterium]
MTTARTVAPAVIEFLRWVDRADRTYADAMEAWQTSCPRLSAFEDATIAGYIVLRRTDGETFVVLTDVGRATL